VETKKNIFEYYNMSAFSMDTTDNNTNIIEEKKNNPGKSKATINTIKNVKQIAKVTLKVLRNIAIIFLGGSLFWYFGIVSHVNALGVDFPVDYYERDTEKVRELKPNAFGFVDIKKVKKSVPLYNTVDDNGVASCNSIQFKLDEINKQYKGITTPDKKTEGESLLYKLSSLKENSEAGTFGFFKYAIATYLQRIIVADMKVISTYFEFFYSFCSEGVGLMLGALFFIPFLFVYCLCHIVSTVGFSFMCVFDFFKTPHYDESRHGINDRWGQVSGWLMNTLFPTPGGVQAPEYEPLSWTDKILRFTMSYVFLLFGIVPNAIASMFCGLYALAKSLGMSGSYKEKTVEKEEKPTPFTLFEFLRNNLHFYSRGYLIWFTLLLVSQLYTDMSMNAAIGCVIAVIILVFGTNVFAKNTFDFSLSGDKCSAPVDDFELEPTPVVAPSAPPINKPNNTTPQ